MNAKRTGTGPGIERADSQKGWVLLRPRQQPRTLRRDCIGPIDVRCILMTAGSTCVSGVERELLALLVECDTAEERPLRRS